MFARSIHLEDNHMEGDDQESKNYKTGVDQVWLGEWLKSIHEEQRKQSGYLRNISLAAGIFTIIAVFSLFFGGCSTLTYY